jgi:hypothetical protein
MMKNIILTYILLFFSLQNLYSQNPSEVKNEIANKNIDDSYCLSELERAFNDFEKKGLIYIIHDEDYDLCRDIDQFESFLKSINIIPIRSKHSSINLKKGNIYCYDEFMKQIIKQKYGDKMILNSLNKIDSLYVLANPNKVYTSLDKYDKSFYYPKAKDINKQSLECINDFFVDFKYPDDFVFSDKGLSKSKVYFILNKNGKIKNLNIKTTFYDKNNNNYIYVFERKIKNFLKKIKWQARRQHNIPVNSEVNLTFFYKHR